MTIQQAVILAAGMGTRLRPLTERLPKAMVPVGGKPLLEHHVEQFRRHGVTQIFINLHHLPDAIRDYCGDGSRWGVRIRYVREEEIRGTAGGVKNFEAELSDDFFVLYADIFSQVDYTRMAEAYRRRGNAIAMELVGETDHPHDSDLVEVGEDLRFLRIHPKPHRQLPSRYRSMRGIYIFHRRILPAIPGQKYYEIDHQLLPDLLRRGEDIYGYECDDYARDMGTMERYREVEEYCRRMNPSA